MADGVINMKLISEVMFNNNYKIPTEVVIDNNRFKNHNFQRTT